MNCEICERGITTEAQENYEHYIQDVLKEISGKRNEVTHPLVKKYQKYYNDLHSPGGEQVYSQLPDAVKPFKTCKDNAGNTICQSLESRKLSWAEDFYSDGNEYCRAKYFKTGLGDEVTQADDGFNDLDPVEPDGVMADYKKDLQEYIDAIPARRERFMLSCKEDDVKLWEHDAQEHINGYFLQLYKNLTKHPKTYTISWEDKKHFYPRTLRFDYIVGKGKFKSRYIPHPELHLQLYKKLIRERKEEINSWKDARAGIIKKLDYLNTNCLTPCGILPCNQVCGNEYQPDEGKPLRIKLYSHQGEKYFQINQIPSTRPRPPYSEKYSEYEKDFDCDDKTGEWFEPEPDGIENRSYIDFGEITPYDPVTKKDLRARGDVFIPFNYPTPKNIALIDEYFDRWNSIKDKDSNKARAVSSILRKLHLIFCDSPEYRWHIPERRKVNSIVEQLRRSNGYLEVTNKKVFFSHLTDELVTEKYYTDILPADQLKLEKENENSTLFYPYRKPRIYKSGGLYAFPLFYEKCESRHKHYEGHGEHCYRNDMNIQEYYRGLLCNRESISGQGYLNIAGAKKMIFLQPNKTAYNSLRKTFLNSNLFDIMDYIAEKSPERMEAVMKHIGLRWDLEDIALQTNTTHQNISKLHIKGLVSLQAHKNLIISRENKAKPNDFYCRKDEEARRLRDYLHRHISHLHRKFPGEQKILKLLLPEFSDEPRVLFYEWVEDRFNG